MPLPFRRRLEILTALIIIVLDQVSKSLVRDSMALWDSVTVIPGFLDLTRVHNTGAAYGMFSATDVPFKAAVLTGVALLALAGVVWYAASIPAEDLLARLGIGSIAGGAIGNLIDRATAGYVLDFVDAYFRGWHFWVFNVADAAITVGVVLMILDLLGLGRRASNTA